jgi:DNA-binding NarL/FixJ family response regulator
MCADSDTSPTLDETIGVFVVEDDRLVREGLRALIAGSPGLACVAVAGSVEAALRERPAAIPRVFLLDIHLPGVRGSVGVTSLLERWPEAAIVMHTVYEEDSMIFEALCRGACGYLLKRSPPARLLEAIHEATRGGAPMSPEIARRVVTLFRRFTPPPQDIASLSPQETRLLALMAVGSSYREAAATLEVSINTVRSHIRSVYDKLRVHTRSEAVAKALRSGLI